MDARHEGTVTYHDSCSSLRELGVRAQPRRLLGTVEGLELTELSAPDVCCGFGGTFCVKYPDISGRMVADKAKGHRRDRRRHGARRRHGLPAQHRRSAEPRGLGRKGAPRRRGAGRHGRSPGHRRAGAGALSRGTPPAAPSSPTRAPGCRTPICRPRLRALPGRLSGQAGGGREAPAGVRGAARRGTRHQGPHPRPSRPLPGALRRAGDGLRRNRPLVPDAGRGATGHPFALPGGGRQDGDQEQVHDRRGDGAQSLPRRA